MNENQNEYVDINAHDNYPDSEQTIEIPTMKVIPLKKICMTIGELPTSYLETMTYYEMLIWFIEYLKNNIIPTINNNSEAIQEVQAVVLALQNYINDYKDSIDSDVEELEEYMNNYFENLDVQEEINNKLDDMLEDGVLEQIIEQFLQLTSLICFDNVADMKSSVNLANGSYAKTLGYHTKNDGGMATYKIRTITNDDVIDEMFIIAMENDNSLIAELIIDSPLKPEQIGAYGDGVHDDTSIIQAGINKVNNLLLPKTYKVSQLIISKGDFNLEFNHIYGSIKVEATQLIQFVKINGKRLTNESGVGLHLVAHYPAGIQYCHFSINLIRADECIKFDSSDGGWINNNYFEETNVSYHTGISSVALNNAYYNGNIFNKMGFEGLTKWFTINNFQESKFNNCRMLPFEADGDGSIRELGTLNNSRNVAFENKCVGTYWEFINSSTNSRGIKYYENVMSAGGTIDGSYLLVQNGTATAIKSPREQLVLDISSLTSGTFPVQVYEYDLTKPIILDFTNGSRYLYMNLNIPSNLENAFKVITVQIIGTTSHEVELPIRNQSFKVIPSGTSDKTFTFII